MGNVKTVVEEDDLETLLQQSKASKQLVSWRTCAQCNGLSALVNLVLRARCPRLGGYRDDHIDESK